MITHYLFVVCLAWCNFLRVSLSSLFVFIFIFILSQHSCARSVSLLIFDSSQDSTAHSPHPHTCTGNCCSWSWVLGVSCWIHLPAVTSCIRHNVCGIHHHIRKHSQPASPRPCIHYHHTPLVLHLPASRAVHKRQHGNKHNHLLCGRRRRPASHRPHCPRRRNSSQTQACAASSPTSVACEGRGTTSHSTAGQARGRVRGTHCKTLWP